MFTSANHSREWDFDLQRFNEGGEPAGEPSPEPSGEPSGEPIPAADPAPEPSPTPFLEVTYNKEKRPLTMEEAIELAQKGMNYDKINERYQTLNNHPGLSFLNELAEENGVPVEQLLDHWRQDRERNRINQLVETQGIPEEVAKEILENRKFRQQYENEQKQRGETQREFERVQQDKADFSEMFPDVNLDELLTNKAHEVWQTVDPTKGRLLTTEYAKWEAKQLRGQVGELQTKLKTFEKNTENANNSPGSVTGGGVPSVGLTEEMIANMSPQEMSKRWSEVKAFYKMQ